MAKMSLLNQTASETESLVRPMPSKTSNKSSKRESKSPEENLERVDYVVLTNVGLEELASQEISGLISGRPLEVYPLKGSGRVDFKASSFLDVCFFTYKNQLASRVLLCLCKISSLDIGALRNEIEKRLDDFSFSVLRDLLSNKTFAVRLRKEEGLDSISTQEWERSIGELIFRYGSGFGAKVNLDGPDVTIIIHASASGCVLGVDLAGFDLSKRSYKVFQHTDSIKATLALGIVRFCGFAKEKVLVDLQTKSGTIPIEAAFFASGMSPRFFEKDRLCFTGFSLFKSVSDEEAFFSKADSVTDFKGKIFAFDENARNVKAAEKNAKIAGVNKRINFSRTEIEWMDTKFEKSSVDCLISNWQSSSRFVASGVRSEDKLLDELFYTAAFVLKKDAKLALLVRKGTDVSRFAAKHSLKILAVHDVLQGQESLQVLVFSKGSSEKKKV
jgi:23S rRNA G2445 N2-methylase RlmL